MISLDTGILQTFDGMVMSQSLGGEMLVRKVGLT